MSVLIKGITLEQFYRDLNNVRDMDVDWDIVQLSDDVVERKTGKWIDVDDYIISGSCSACGWQAHLYEDDVVGMNFCPNCGADMRGEKDDEIERA